MPNIIFQALRSSTPTFKPGVSTRQPGELWVNFADHQLGVIDAGQVATPLIAIRFFASTTNYSGADWVIANGTLYIAKSAVPAGPFNPAQWTPVALSTDIAGIYLPLTGGTLTGTLLGTNATFTGGVTSTVGAVLSTLNVGNASNAGSININGPNATNRGILFATGVGGASARWGILCNSGSEAANNAGSDLQLNAYDNNGAYLRNPLSINRASGVVAIPAALQIAGVAPNGGAIYISGANATQRVIQFQTNGQQRFTVCLSNGNEAGGQVGSDFQIFNFNDQGAFIGAPMQINRASQQAIFSVPISNGSDRAFKENIEPIKDPLNKVLQLKGVRFNRIGAKEKEIGFIAQDVAPIVPEVVRSQTTTLPADAPAAAKKLYAEPKLGITYAQITALLVEAVKELTAKVTALEAKLA